jgi:spermidine synthase
LQNPAANAARKSTPAAIFRGGFRVTQAPSSTIGLANPGKGQLSWTIFLVSVVGLLVEMLLIRLIGTEIRIFAYLQNTVLIVCFLGLGVGCFTCRQPIRLMRGLLALLVLTALVTLPFLKPWRENITEHLSAASGLVIWGGSRAELSINLLTNAGWALAITFLVMLLLWEIFLPLGRILARAMGDHPSTIWAYSVNVSGSLLGILLFVLLSSLALPPVVWIGVAAALLAVLAWNLAERRAANLAVIAGTVLVAAIGGLSLGGAREIWSPYQKLTYIPGHSKDSEEMQLILVNNIGYQALIDNSAAAVRANPRVPTEMHGLTQYDVPSAFHPCPERVLIVGAGSGNDVAGALRGGATEVTAVEIDPLIIELGRRFHPERPYDSPYVEIVNDDARSYFATSDKKFDLIVFGLLDSHTTTLLSNARLDHYVYTRESLQRARSLLAEGGVMVLSFDATRDFIADRMSRCLDEVFGTRPLAFRIPFNPTGWGGVVFVAGDQAAIEGQLATNEQLAGLVRRWQAEHPLVLAHQARVATDDWPYIYLPRPQIPLLYVLLAVLLAGLAAYGCCQVETRRVLAGWNASHWHFFCMGAAFMLLEVLNISKASVALGNTWVVNAVIVSAIMVMILASNLIAATLPRIPQWAVALCLVGSCLALYLVDLSWFGGLPYLAKACVVGGLTTLPMLFSGLIFIDSFARAERKDAALGANLLGALAGGILQSVTFVTGVGALLLIVAALYAAALVAKRWPAAVAKSTATPESGWRFWMRPMYSARS